MLALCGLRGNVRASTSMNHIRLRLTYAAAAAGIIVSGLLWRSGLLGLPPFVAKYGGDALWAMLVFCGVRCLAPRLSRAWTIVAALLFAFSVEFAQLYHAPWIDSIRSTRLGTLALGKTFNWPDLPAYAFGVLLAAAIERGFEEYWLSLSRVKPR
jgi:hypothetical protein